MKRTALVTGANRGIGFEVCRQLAEQGIRVIGVCRNEKSGEEARKKLAEMGAQVIFETLDVTDVSAIRDLEKRFTALNEQIDILINNAGVFMDNGKTILDVDSALFSDTFAINTLGPIEMSRAFMGGMMKRRWGRIVNVSSGMGQYESLDGWAAAYRLSKAALNAATVMLADAGRDYGVQVNAVCPGWVKTEMGGSGATREVAKGAETIVWLATRPDDFPSGRMWRDKQEIAF